MKLYLLEKRTRSFTHILHWCRKSYISHPAYGTWTADFMLWQNESRTFLGKYLNDPRVPWRHKRPEMMATAGIIPVAKWLAKIKQRSDVSCRLCKRAREQRGASTENLPEETYEHINSAFCDGMHRRQPSICLESRAAETATRMAASRLMQICLTLHATLQPSNCI